MEHHLYITRGGGGGGGGTIAPEGGQYLLANSVRGGQNPLVDSVRGNKICGQNLLRRHQKLKDHVPVRHEYFILRRDRYQRNLLVR